MNRKKKGDRLVQNLLPASMRCNNGRYRRLTLHLWWKTQFFATERPNYALCLGVIVRKTEKVTCREYVHWTDLSGYPTLTNVSTGCMFYPRIQAKLSLERKSSSAMKFGSESKHALDSPFLPELTYFHSWPARKRDFTYCSNHIEHSNGSGTKTQA